MLEHHSTCEVVLAMIALVKTQVTNNPDAEVEAENLGQEVHKIRRALTISASGGTRH